MKKLLALLLALTLIGSLAACSKTESGEDSQGEETAVPRIGVIQLTAHPALDAALEGFVEALDESGFAYEIDVQNAGGEQSNCATIANKLVNDKVDLILAIATPAAQAAAQATTEIPILVTAVTSPAYAGLVESNEEATGGNVSGTSDMNPVADQIDLLLSFVPEAKTIGLLFNASEDNSILQVEMAEKALSAKGIDTLRFTATETSQVQSVVQSMVGKVDGVYIPTDNLMADTMATIVMVLNPAGIPTVGGEGNMVTAGALATYSFSYKELGRQTAAQALQILRDGVDVGTIPIGFYNGELETVINGKTAEELGIEIPEELQNAVQ